MYENIQVQCSGAFYTSLHCEIINNAGIQEGFLKGEIEKHTSFDISDSDLNNENAVVKINISGYVPCSTVGSFYNGCGKINPIYIEHLTDNVEEIVGWYRCRRCTNGTFLREIKIHEQLCELFSSREKYFLFSLFTRSDETRSCTMDVSYKFQVMLNSSGEFSSIPLSIINLNNTSAAGYIKAASSTLYNSEALEKILSKIQNLEPGVEEVESIHMGLIHQVQSLLPKFASIQEQYRHALNRVNHLRQLRHNYEFELDPDNLSNWNKKSADDKSDSDEDSEKDRKFKFKSKSENNSLIKSKGSDASSIEKSKKLANDENLKKILRLKDDGNGKSISISKSPSQKVNVESSYEKSKKKVFNKKEVLTTIENIDKESLSDSTCIKDLNTTSVGKTPDITKDTSKGGKSETNVKIPINTVDTSDLSEKTNDTAKNTCSDSPEF